MLQQALGFWAASMNPQVAQGCRDHRSGGRWPVPHQLERIDQCMRPCRVCCMHDLVIKRPYALQGLPSSIAYCACSRLNAPAADSNGPANQVGTAVMYMADKRPGQGHVARASLQLLLRDWLAYVACLGPCPQAGGCNGAGIRDPALRSSPPPWLGMSDQRQLTVRPHGSPHHCIGALHATALVPQQILSIGVPK